jgi:hypothetical protein
MVFQVIGASLWENLHRGEHPYQQSLCHDVHGVLFDAFHSNRWSNLYELLQMHQVC